MKKFNKRFFALALCLLMLLSLVPAVSAEEAEGELLVSDLIEQTNKLAAGSNAVSGAGETQWNELLGAKPENVQVTMDASVENEVKNGLSVYGDTPVSELLAYLRTQLKARKASFSFTYYSTSTYDYDAFAKLWIPKSFEHTGEPTEGDYLMWHWRTWGYGYEGIAKQYVTYTYRFTYLTTAAQETATDTAVSNLLNQLNLDGKSDYKKVCAIYDWMCDNITYDYTGLDAGVDSSPTTWSAYKGIVKGTCVCQGYASLFYRLALEVGVDARVITGDGGGPHAWNIVKLGGKYYNLDATWDAGQSTYDYFLRCDANFGNHTRDTDYSTSDFYTEYPMSSTDYTPGAAVQGDMDGDGELTVDDAIYLLLHIMFGADSYPLAA